MTLEAIQQAIPHRPPMLLIDEVLEQTANAIVCRKTFREGEYFFQGHYPGQPIVPGVILCESAMQAGAVLLAQFIDDASGVPVATRLNDVRFRQVVRPGDTVQQEVELVERLAGAFFLKARVTRGGKVAVRFEFACTMTEVSP